MISKRFVVKRLLLLVPVLLGVATFVFAILQLSPGDPAKVVAGQRASKAFVEQVRHQMGLDRPIWVQYLDFLWKALHLNLGKSYQIRKGVPVTNILLHRLPVTVEMAIYGQIIGILFGIPLGVISAIKQDSATDHLTRSRRADRNQRPDLLERTAPHPAVRPDISICSRRAAHRHHSSASPSLPASSQSIRY